ncbi:hypothetical protein [Euzebya sp.]|uniref:hypothetical protein n=1 Tax=Euzebya sp. TaxID=1971409 RepID=UPI0035169A7F
MASGGGFWPAAPERRWWHHVAAAPLLVVLLWWPFVLGRRVPLLGWVDLAVHEFGHVATVWLPEVVTFAMGGGAQVALPLTIAAGLWWRSDDRLGAGIALAWAGSAAQDVSVYIADAPYQRLPLIGGLHDWATLLGPRHLDALGAAALLARGVWLAGLLLGLAGVAVVAMDGWTRWRERDVPAVAGTPAGWSLDPSAPSGGAAGGRDRR